MFLVVGAGLTGATIAQQLHENNKEVMVIEKLPHIGGLCYEINGIHKYGPHIFHTNNDKVWKYLSNFTDWIDYIHTAKTEVDNKLLPLPANLETLIELFGDSFIYDDFQKLPNKLFKKLYEGYSKKQWGEWFESLDSEVWNRIPIRLNNDDRYFTDKYQALPKYGYTEMIDNMLKDIPIKLNTDHLEGKWEHIFYTGTIDGYYNHKLGNLPYRSLKFKEDKQTKLLTSDLKTPDINIPYTRSIDYRYITGAEIVIREYPTSEGLEMYPIPTQQNKELFDKYNSIKHNNITFCGRLGKYCYFNMDAAVEDALKIVNSYLKLEK